LAKNAPKDAKVQGNAAMCQVGDGLDHLTRSGALKNKTIINQIKLRSSAYEFSPMNSLKSLTSNAKLFYVLVFGIFIAILMRNSALYPSVFADEYTYSTFSRLIPLSEAPISNYLYLAVYRLTNTCGDGFLNCARVINLLFFVLASPFIYKIARKVCSQSLSMIVVLLSLIAPGNTYTAYFMPESMYFWAFWVLAWLILRVEESGNNQTWTLIGMWLAVCALIKPHGFFLLLPVAIYLFYLLRTSGKYSFKLFLERAGCLFVSFIALKAVIPILFFGASTDSFFGNTYTATIGDFFRATSPQIENQTNLASNPIEVATEVHLAAGEHPIVKLFRLWLINLGGHIWGLMVVFFLPLCAMWRLSMRKAVITRVVSNEKKYLVFFSLLICCLIIISSLYSAFVTLSSGGEIYRIHVRYYFFLFPFFIIFLAANIGAVYSKNKLRKLDVFFITFSLVLLVYAFYFFLAPYQITSIDFPDLKGLLINKTFFGMFILFSLGMGVISFLVDARSTRVMALLFFAIFLLLDLIFVGKNIHERATLDVYDRAGIVVKQLLTTGEQSKLIVIGDNPIELTRTLFYIDNAKVSAQSIPGSIEFLPSMMPSDKKWALLIGDRKISDNFQNQNHFNGFSLVGGEGLIEVSFRGAEWSVQPVAQVTGLFMPPEAWGAWSTKKLVSMTFKQALPENFEFRLNGRAFGVNAGKTFFLKCGENSYPFRLTEDFSTISLKVLNKSRSRTITIEVPDPQSPKQLGIGDDERSLGVGMRSVEIIWN
jgi:phosphoglycerol transferase